MNLLLILLFLFRNEGLVPVQSLSSKPVPTKEQAMLMKSEPTDWIVKIKDGQVLAATDKKLAQEPLPFKAPKRCSFRGSQSAVQTSDGYLVAYNNGELGGFLVWYDLRGRNCKQIEQKRFEKLFSSGDEVIAVESLPHLSVNYPTSLWRIVKRNGNWDTEFFMNISEHPKGIDLDSKNNVIIVTSNKILRVSQNKSVEALIINGFWENALYPNSLVIRDDVAYIGMRKGVLKYDLDTSTQEWLVKE